jgi:hypothetical protein
LNLRHCADCHSADPFVNSLCQKSPRRRIPDLQCGLS